MIQQRVPALIDAIGPGVLLAAHRCPGGPAVVAGTADLAIDALAIGTIAAATVVALGGRRRTAILALQAEIAHRLQALGDGIALLFSLNGHGARGQADGGQTPQDQFAGFHSHHLSTVL